MKFLEIKEGQLVFVNGPNGIGRVVKPAYKATPDGIYHMDVIFEDLGMITFCAGSCVPFKYESQFEQLRHMRVISNAVSA